MHAVIISNKSSQFNVNFYQVVWYPKAVKTTSILLSGTEILKKLEICKRANSVQLLGFWVL